MSLDDFARVPLLFGPSPIVKRNFVASTILSRVLRFSNQLPSTRSESPSWP